MLDIEKDDYENMGYEFNYANNRLGKSKIISKEKINEIDTAKSNSDTMYVKCVACKIYMDYEAGPTGVVDGSWVCPECGISVKEHSAYTQLERENEEFLTRSDLTEDDMPEGCGACGGPWPNCTSSCKMFDD